MNRSNAFKIALTSTFALVALAGCGQPVTVQEQVAERAANAQLEAQDGKLTEASYQVLFTRNGCEIGRYSKFYHGTRYGNDVQVALCPGGGAQTMDTYQTGGKVKTTHEDVVSQTSAAPAASAIAFKR